MRKVVDAGGPLLDALAAIIPEASRTTLRQMLAAGRIEVNGAVEKVARRELKPGDVVSIGSREQHSLLPAEISRLYEDDALMVVVKPPGLLTVATAGERERTLQAMLNGYLRATGKGPRIHVVHRLDRDASGILVFAKSHEVREMLTERFAAHDIDRVYSAVVEGAPQPTAGMVRSHLWEGRDLTVRSVDPAAYPNAKLAVTHYRTLAAGSRYAEVEVTLETGRKNQIRAHLSEKGNPIAGDDRYGAATNPLGRLALHARILGFEHPTTGKAMRFENGAPSSFRGLVDRTPPERHRSL